MSGGLMRTPFTARAADSLDLPTRRWSPPLRPSSPRRVHPARWGELHPARCELLRVSAELCNATDVLLLLGKHLGDAEATAASSPGSADAMNVPVVLGGRLVV